MAFPPSAGLEAENRTTYAAPWRAFALRRNAALFLLASWIPVCIGLFLSSRYSIHQPVASLAIMFAWFCAAVAATWWAGEFRCPRCSRRYGALGHGRGFSFTRGLFDRICPNCQLSKFPL